MVSFRGGSFKTIYITVVFFKYALKGYSNIYIQYIYFGFSLPSPISDASTI